MLCFTSRRGSRGVVGGGSVWFQGADGSIDRGGGRGRVGVDLYVVVHHVSRMGVTMGRTHFVMSFRDLHLICSRGVVVGAVMCFARSPMQHGCIRGSLVLQCCAVQQKSTGLQGVISGG